MIRYIEQNSILIAVPHANMYVVVNPIRLAVDYLTLVWLNAFSLNLLHSLVSKYKKSQIPAEKLLHKKIFKKIFFIRYTKYFLVGWCFILEIV